jgi:hypothetical protein
MKIDEFLSSVVDEWGEESNSWLPKPLFNLYVGWNSGNAF